MKKQNERKSKANNNFNSKAERNGAQNCNTRATNKAGSNMSNVKNDFAQNEADKNRFGY